jgi:hypothetical protein
MAIHAIASKPGRADSATVGRSGMATERCRLPTAMALRRPAFTCGRAPGPVSNITDTSPAISAVRAGGPPLKGTCTMSIPARLLNISIARWLVTPLPPEA